MKESNTNNSKLPNKRRTQQWRPLANIVTLHWFTSLFVILNTSSRLTLHLLLPVPAIRLPSNGHFQLHFRMKIKCSMAFQHLLLMFLICKNSGGRKCPTADQLVIYGWDTSSRNLTDKTAKIFQNTNYQQPIYQQKLSQTSCSSWHRNAAFISQRLTLQNHMSQPMTTLYTARVYCSDIGWPLATHWSHVSCSLQLWTVLLKLTLRRFTLHGFGIFCISTKLP